MTFLFAELLRHYQIDEFLKTTSPRARQARKGRQPCTLVWELVRLRKDNPAGTGLTADDTLPGPRTFQWNAADGHG